MTTLDAAVRWASQLPVGVDYDQEVRAAGARLVARPGFDPGCADALLVTTAQRAQLRWDAAVAARESQFFGNPKNAKLLTIPELVVFRKLVQSSDWGKRTYFWFRHPTDGRLVRWLQMSGRPLALERDQRVRLTGRVKEHLAGGLEPITVMASCLVEPLG